MKAVFIESSEFTEWVAEFLPDDAYSGLQQELMDQPKLVDELKRQALVSVHRRTRRKQ